jgi:hypothetical protein
MHIDVFKFLRRNQTQRAAEKAGKTVKLDRTGLFFEYRMHSEKFKFSAFLDIAATYYWDGGKDRGATSSDRAAMLIGYEIKPKIYSVGAIVRELKAQEAYMAKLTPPHPRMTEYDFFRCFPVLSANDEKLPMYLELFGAYVWDAERQELAWENPRP